MYQYEQHTNSFHHLLQSSYPETSYSDVLEEESNLNQRMECVLLALIHLFYIGQ